MLTPVVGPLSIREDNIVSIWSLGSPEDADGGFIFLAMSMDAN